MGKQRNHDRHDQWGDSQFDEEAQWMEELEPFDEEGGTMFIEEAHEALNKLHQKTNKRGRLMRLPKRAESWR